MREFFRTHVTRRLIFFVIVFGVAVVLLVTDYEKDYSTRRPFVGLLYKNPQVDFNRPKVSGGVKGDSTLAPPPSLPPTEQIDTVLNPNGRKIQSSVANETLKGKEEIPEDVVVVEHLHKVTTVKPKKERRLEDEFSLPVSRSEQNYTIPDENATVQPVEVVENEVKVNEDTKKGYLVYSEACQIPDVDPYHATVRKLIATTPPLDCSKDYPELTSARGNVLKINASLVEYWKKKSNANVTATDNELLCCYNEVFRAKDGRSDNSIGFSKNCTPIKDGEEVRVEFIIVRCLLKGHGVIYKNYHSFVTDKPATEERCLNYDKNRTKVLNSEEYNVLIIGADAMSRMNMHRQLKKTFEYLTRSMGGIEMNGFNKVGDNTFPNLIPLLMGVRDKELPEVCRNSSDPMDNCRIIWDEFAEAGYRTFYAEDTPHISTFNYVKPGFLTQPTDYYYRTMIHPYEDDLGRKKKLNCHLCVGSMAEAQAVLDYGARFVSNFGQRKYFAMSWINSMSHDFLNSASSGDHFFAQFFQSLHRKSSLDDTFVILMGDHGLRWGAIRETHIGRMEERLPMLVIVPPKNFASKYPELYKNLRTNANRLVTPFDLYATLQNVLRFEGSATEVTPDSVPDEPQLERLRDAVTKRAISLFAPIPRNRGCEDASIAEAWCACHRSEPVDVNDEEVSHVARFMTLKINAMFENHPECSTLELKNVSKASLRTPKNKLNAERVPTSNIFDYTVEIETRPGDAKFEGTIRYVPFKHEHELLGDVSRLNVYGNQSSCVKDATLRKYCYCKTTTS